MFTNKLVPINVQTGLQEIRFSRIHPKFLAMAEVKKPRWIPPFLYFLCSGHNYIGKTGRVMIVEVGSLSKETLFTVLFENEKGQTIGVFLEDQLDFHAGKTLT